MGGIVAGLRPIYTFPITLKTFFDIVKIRMAGILGPKSTSSIITTYITPLITMNTFVNRT